MLYSYFLIAELNAAKLTVVEILLWFWAGTLSLDEIRQVCV